jgi:predicted AlkP superfamily pyrophosphatase or phosphodiesterase
MALLFLHVSSSVHEWNNLFNSDASFEKKQSSRLHHIRHRQPYLPPFIQEMNNNPEYVMKFLKQDHRLDSSILISQIEKEIKLGL